MKQLDTTLYFITDSTGLNDDELFRITEQALAGGATIMQLREKNRTTREYIRLAKHVHEISLRYKVPLIIDDRLDVAMAVNAEGVHLGQSDMPVKTARKIVSDKMIIGATTKTVEQALEAEESGADYLGVGAIYPTTTKVKTVLTSVDTLKDICKAVSIPVNAIGGLNKTNCEILKITGKEGIIASKIAAHAADIAKGIPNARERDNAMAQARHNVDWDEMFRIAVDGEKARAYFESTPTADRHTCSMCGKMCAVRITNMILEGKKVEFCTEK